MPTMMMCLLFVAAPVVAALAFDFDSFVPLLILLCVIAGLSSSSQEKTIEPANDGREPARQPSGQLATDGRARTIDPAGTSNAGRSGSLEFSRL